MRKRSTDHSSRIMSRKMCSWISVKPRSRASTGPVTVMTVGKRITSGYGVQIRAYSSPVSRRLGLSTIIRWNCSFVMPMPARSPSRRVEQ